MKSWGWISHSQGLSNNPYPEPNHFWYLANSYTEPNKYINTKLSLLSQDNLCSILCEHSHKWIYYTDTSPLHHFSAFNSYLKGIS